MASDSNWQKEFAVGEIGAEVGGRPGRFAHILLVAVVSFFVLFFFWSSSAELDQVTRGEGKIIPSSQIQVVQHLEGGIVADIRVAEGDLWKTTKLLFAWKIPSPKPKHVKRASSSTSCWVF